MTGPLEFLGEPLGIVESIGLLFLIVSVIRHGVPGLLVGGSYAFAAWCVLLLGRAIAGDTGVWVVGAILLGLWGLILYNFKAVAYYLSQTRLVTIFKIKELRQKIIITILFLAIYRIGFHIPLPMIDQREMAK